MSLRASGNVGPLCYARWRGNIVARGATTAVQPWSTAQKKYTDNMEAVAAAWSTVLTAAERAQWDAFARNRVWRNRLGQRVIPIGYQVFMKMGCLAKSMGSSYLTSPPISVPSALPSVWSVTNDPTPGKILVELSGYPVGSEPDVIQVFKTPPFDTIGRHAQPPDYRYFAHVDSPFVCTITGLSSGKYYWIRARWGYTMGIVGNWYSQQILIS